jgi:hypothetical protein
MLIQSKQLRVDHAGLQADLQEELIFQWYVNIRKNQREWFSLQLVTLKLVQILLQLISCIQGLVLLLQNLQQILVLQV